MLYVSRAVYHAAIDGWLDHKAEYNVRYDGDFVGVGDIVFKGAVKLDRACHLSMHLAYPGESRDPFKMVDVNVYRSWKFTIDMERG